MPRLSPPRNPQWPAPWAKSLNPAGNLRQGNERALFMPAELTEWPFVGRTGPDLRGVEDRMLEDFGALCPIEIDERSQLV